ncbi:MAG: diguanylate cyclase [Chloroflexi bacterium]|nr:diguanylate cyclase [Chloroflexota bacterium]
MENLKLPIALLEIALIVDLFIALIAWRKRRFPGGLALFFLMLAASEWSLFVILELYADTLPSKILCSQFAYIGSQSCPVLFLLLALAYTGEIERLRRRHIPLLFIVPFITLIFAFTNQYHGLIWTSFTPYPGNERIIQYGHGPVFWIGVIGYSYLCLAIGALVIAQTIMRRKSTYRWQAISMLTATILPWLGNLMYITKINPFPGIDVSPIAFSLAGVIIAISILRFRFLDIAPIARDILFEKMVDNLIVLDPNNRVIDINPSALQLVDTTYQKCIGMSAADLLNTQFAQLLEPELLTTSQTEISWGESQDKILDVTLIPIMDKDNVITGRVLVAKDITKQQFIESQLQQANTTLQQQLDKINKLQETLREQAIRDPLTGLYNRRFLDDILTLQIGQAQRDNTSISLVMLDLDNFKIFNDTYGHSAGDAILKNLAEILKTKTRHGDFACRFGGEEFLVVMPGATLSAGLKRAEEWRQEFEGNPIIYEGETLNSTFSAGVATYPFHAITIDGLIKIADKGLYLAKNAGRNRVASMEITASDVPQYHTNDKIV